MSRSSAARGFSLLELLVVMGLLALIAATASGLAWRRLARVEIDQATQEIVDSLRGARLRAIRRGSLELVQLGPGMALQTPGETTARDSTAGPAPAIAMHADGTSSGGVIHLARDGRQRWVTVDWLTGAVRVRETP